MNEKEDFMLTTFDNPFNPFENFEIWWKEDLRLTHDCCGLLAKTANLSQVFSDEVNDQEIRRAAKEIVSRWPMIYRIVTRSDFAKAG